VIPISAFSAIKRMLKLIFSVINVPDAIKIGEKPFLLEPFNGNPRESP
jgi:hypothetical protein